MVPPSHELTIEALQKESELAWKLVEHWKERVIRWQYATIGALALALLSFATNWGWPW